MKTQSSQMTGKLFSLPVFVFLFLLAGCATSPQPVAPPVPPKPDTSEDGSAGQKAGRETAPSAPTAPGPSPAEPAKPAAPPAPPPSEPSPSAEIPQAPIAAGAVLLDPSASDDAKTIQSRLADLGFYKMAIDGAWGRGSRDALRAYKEKNGLKKDEQWDKETQIALFSKGASPVQPVDTSDPLASGAVFLNPSDSQDVQTIQGRLAELGFYNGAIDGIWGQESRAALRAFKEKNSLPIPEKWDKETQMLLFREVRK
jgi:peptidoglycan hydrolase-like protein with peptidoglycan-binding domain